MSQDNSQAGGRIVLEDEALVRSRAAAAKTNRKTLWIMLAMTVVPIALAFFVFHTGIGVPHSTVNKGALLKAPLPIEPLLDSAERERIAAEPKWRLLVPVDASCQETNLESMPNAESDPCAYKLYLTRQVFLRLGAKGRRVERLVLNVGDAQGKDYIDSVSSQLPYAQFLSVSPAAFRSWLASAETFDDDKSSQQGLQNMSLSDYYYLIDPEGRAMMRYGVEVAGNDLLKDLKRTLKHTPDYRT